uniref:Uncharacterized protein n=1 Tax=Rhizophora mucronata TaxID=61149 RepID=A0A2P2P3Y1_RHIMU
MFCRSPGLGFFFSGVRGQDSGNRTLLLAPCKCYFCCASSYSCMLVWKIKKNSSESIL